MKYKNLVLEAYNRIGFSPRDNQLANVDAILTAYLDEGFQDVVLSAPTGTGKSIIGAAVGEAMAIAQEQELASLIVIHNNSLVKQYRDTFKDDPNFMKMKGASNYPCGVLIDAGETESNADNCIFPLLNKHGQTELLEKYCGRNCEYRATRLRKNKVRHLITNYSYYFIDRMFSETLDMRNITIWDEAHTINDVFTEHNAIYISSKRLDALLKEITEHLKLGNTQVYRDIQAIKRDVEACKITEQNYMSYLQPLYSVYKRLKEDFENLAESNARDYNKYNKYQKISRKYFDFGCKIGDLLNYSYEHVVNTDEKDQSVTIKPIFVGKMFEETLRFAPHNLFMSATISDKFMTRTMQFTEAPKLIVLDPSFPPENKKVVFYKQQSLNYSSMKDEKTLKNLDSAVIDIVRHHGKEQGQSGIVLAPSFDVTSRIAEQIRKTERSVEVFEHVRGNKLEHTLDAFKKFEGTGILISPSMFEGIDLAGDLSRYQIFVKAPFGSLGDKRMKFILNHHQDIYNILTIMKLVQGCGRSVRSSDDFATTYMLDSNIGRLWSSSDNIWKKEFITKYMSMLEV